MIVQQVIKNILDILKKYNLSHIINNSGINADVNLTFHTCLKYSIAVDGLIDDNKFLEIDSILDFLHDELNTGHWSAVPLPTRQCFTVASFIKCLILLKAGSSCNMELFKNCLKCLDMGLLLGAPIGDNEFITKSAHYLVQLIQNKDDLYRTDSVTKRKLDENYKLNYDLINGKEVSTEVCPSLEQFNKNYFKTQVPTKIQDCMDHWPAYRKWINVDYLLSVAGDRTVPIEIGSHYTDENWTQKLMTLKDFILNHYLSENGDIGYLAQHNLFEQITELKEDICIPEYCCLSFDYENATEPDINAWFGPKGTVSPLHYDPKNNILAQVYGTKQLILFSPKDSSFLYPHEDKMLFNTARVDPLKPDLDKYPDFSKTEVYKCLLEAGEMLFIPEKWWHHVTALDKSFSVSFWWQ